MPRDYSSPLPTAVQNWFITAEGDFGFASRVDSACVVSWEPGGRVEGGGVTTDPAPRGGASEEGGFL